MAFPCEHPGCTRSYRRKEHLLRHQRAHSAPRSFTCLICPAAFNRRDLLNRHILKVHGTSQERLRAPRDSTSRKYKPTYGAGNKAGRAGESEPEPESGAAMALGGTVLIELGAEYTQPSSRRLLEQLYFREFHPHWPILHPHTIQTKTQPDELVQVILVAGLWMMDTEKTKPSTESYHEQLAKKLCQYLCDIDRLINLCNAPQSKFLPYFQSFMIILILSTYRGAYMFPSIIVDLKRLVQLFHHSGVLDQHRIDAENPLCPVAQEQFQRLALVLFKLFVHLNGLVITHFPTFRLFDFLEPAMLRVRIPVCERAWSTSSEDYMPEGDNRTALVGGLFLGDATTLTYQALTSIAAWDYSTGMIMGCFLQKQPDDDLPRLMNRVARFLFWHLNLRAAKGGEEQRGINAPQAIEATS